MKILIPLSIIAFVLGISAGLYFFSHTNQTQTTGHSQMNYPPGGDFTLHEGEHTVRLSDYQGKVRLIFFGYTSCPDICPTTLAVLNSALKKLTDKERANTKIFFISVDPKRDTPEKLKKYTHFFNQEIVGITGTKEEIDKVVKQYGATYRINKSDSPLSYSVDHLASVFVIDPKGKIVDMLPNGLPISEIVNSIRKYQP